MEQSADLINTRSNDDEDLSIVIRPRPPRRRQSGISLVPFRPYVKSLTSVREPFSFANGEDQWITSGQREIFFKQENARCIGSLLDDCDVSDVIRWDIEGESTRLPMMCKLWMIVDGAVVERGKPHLVQDAAIQVLTAGRNLRAILANQQRFNQTGLVTFNRRRRQSWHDVNEYHSVPYHQYTRCIRSGYQEYTQCDLDNEESISKERQLDLVEETADEDISSVIPEPERADRKIHEDSILNNHLQLSVTTQTERELKDCSTSVDLNFIQMFHLNLETNENLLSPLVDPNVSNASSTPSWEITSFHRRGVEYINRCVSTGDDYPHWWLQLSTNVILSDHLSRQDGTKIFHEKIVQPSVEIPSPISPRSLQDQSVQTENDQIRPPSSIRSSRVRNSSSSMTMSNHYQLIDEIDDGNNNQRYFLSPRPRQRVADNDSQDDLESRCSDYQTDALSSYDNDRKPRATSSSKYSESGYNTFALALDNRSYSTPDHQQSLTPKTDQKLNQSKNSLNTSSTSVVGTLLERYERTLRERQRAIAIINDQSMDINELIVKYREKINCSSSTNGTLVDGNRPVEEKTTETMSLTVSNTKRPQSVLSSISNENKTKYRRLPSTTTEQMLRGYVPSPRLNISNSILTSPRQRKPRHDYYNLSLSDDILNSAWIRYNERRIDQIQKRIDLMLQIDDNEETQFLLSTCYPVNQTVTQHIDDILTRRSRNRNQISMDYDRILLPRRYQFTLPYRLNQTVPSSPRLATRHVSRSTTPTPKSVRISTKQDFIPSKINPTQENSPRKSSRPIVSILRRNPVSFSPRSRRLVDKNHVWKNDVDGKVYILEQFSIPRYYRLYNDVSFREVYKFSCLLESYFDRHEKPSATYSSLIKNFALDQQIPTEITL